MSKPKWNDPKEVAAYFVQWYGLDPDEAARVAERVTNRGQRRREQTDSEEHGAND